MYNIIKMPGVEVTNITIVKATVSFKVLHSKSLL